MSSRLRRGEGPDWVADPTTGATQRRVLRGGALRLSGYAIGVVLSVAATVLLLRTLTPIAFAMYVSAVAILGIVDLVADSTVTVIGQRRYVETTTDRDRRDLLAGISAARLAIFPVGIVAAVGFDAIASYPSGVFLGTVIAGLGLMINSFGNSFAVVLYSELRFATLTVTGLVHQVIFVAYLGIVVALGGNLTAIFGADLAAGVATTVVILMLVRPSIRTAPRFRPSTIRRILRESGLVALTEACTSIYDRIFVLMTAIVTPGKQAGLFGASYRVVDAIVAVPGIVADGAFPVLSYLSSRDDRRFREVLAGLAETAIFVSLPVAVTLAISAKSVTNLVAGSRYLDAVPVVRIYAALIPFAFVNLVWGYGLWASRRESTLLAVTSAVTLSVALAVGVPLIIADGARGAAIAALCVEGIVTITALGFVPNDAPRLELRTPFLAKLLASVALSIGVVLLVDMSPALAALVSAAIYFGSAIALGAVPEDLRRALRVRPQSFEARG